MQSTSMWDGPRNNSGKRIWFPIDRGTDFSFWDGNVPFATRPGAVWMGSGESGLLQRRRFPDLLPWPTGETSRSIRGYKQLRGTR